MLTRWDALRIADTGIEVDLTEDERELQQMLNEPIQGLTREDRFDDMEAAAFAQALQTLGG